MHDSGEAILSQGYNCSLFSHGVYLWDLALVPKSLSGQTLLFVWSVYPDLGSRELNGIARVHPGNI